jgi:hypothetical protein
MNFLINLKSSRADKELMVIAAAALLTLSIIKINGQTNRK